MLPHVLEGIWESGAPTMHLEKRISKVDSPLPSSDLIMEVGTTFLFQNKGEGEKMSAIFLGSSQVKQVKDDLSFSLRLSLAQT